MKITIRFPADRTQLGVLTVEGSQFTCVCYGKSDNAAAQKRGNPTRNPLLPFGDTPLGTYRATVGKAYAWQARSYGPHPVIRLEPTGGDALKAAANKRSGLLIHGGDRNASGKLRPTHGCVRLGNEDQKMLLGLLWASGEKAHDVEIVEARWPAQGRQRIG